MADNLYIINLWRLRKLIENKLKYDKYEGIYLVIFKVVNRKKKKFWLITIFTTPVYLSII